MALSVNLDWYIRSTSTGTNSGGFDDSVTSPGTNWADADSSQATGTNLTVDGTTNTIVTPDGHTPTSADNGNVVVVTTTTGGWTAGYYTIESNDGTSWTLDRSPAATSVASGAWSVGGAFVDGVPLGLDAVAAAITSPLAAGHQVNVRGDGSDDPSTVHVQASSGTPAYRNVPDGSITNAIRLVGYNGRAHWRAGNGLLFYVADQWYVENMKFTINGTANGSLGMMDMQNSVIHDCIFDLNGVTSCSAVLAQVITDCEFRNSGSKTPSSTATPVILFGYYTTVIEGCTFIDIVQPIFIGGTVHSLVFVNNFVIRNYNTVFALKVATGDERFPSVIANNTFHDCDGDAIITTGSYAVGAEIRNNVFTIAGGYFINQETSANLNPNVYDFNTFGAGTMGATSGPYNNYSGGANDVTMASDLDPYTDKAGSDFSLDDTNGTNAKANAFPGSIRGLSTTNYKDRGAAQRQEAGGGTVVIVNNRRRI